MSAERLADLARLLRGLPADQHASAAALLGYREIPARAERPEPMAARTAEASRIEAAQDIPEVTAHVAARTLMCRVERSWEVQFAEREPAGEDSGGLTDADFDDDGRSLFAAPPVPDLAPWPMFWPALHARVRRERASNRPDVPRLLRTLSRAEICARVPRRRVFRWPARLYVILDRRRALTAVWRDQDRVVERLRAAIGESGLVVACLDDASQAHRAARSGDFLGDYRFDAGDAVLVVGDLGMHPGGEARSRWQRLGERLRAEGVQRAALVPCSPQRWRRDVATLWIALPWGGASHAEKALEVEGQVDRLLTLVSSTAFAQPALLRALRLLQPEIGVSAEIEAYAHADVLAADATGVLLDPERAGERVKRFVDSADHELLRGARDVINEHRALQPSELAHAETLRWIGARAAEELIPGDAARACELAKRLCVALTTTNAPEPVRREVAAYARAMMSALPDETYARVPELKRAWGAVFASDATARLPSTMRPDEVIRPGEAPPHPRWWGVWQRGDELVVRPRESEAWPSDAREGAPVGVFRASSPRLWVRRGAETRADRIDLESEARIAVGHGCALETDGGGVRVERWGRPLWAVAAGCDRYGQWAEFGVRGVRHRMRWIPPGTFWMGSPADEPGRFDDEGPRRRVTLTRGYWLGATPVTQALWEAVAGENPSHFRRGDRHPVEQVSWVDCDRFCARLSTMVPGLFPRLPSEAEWERACRAGTDGMTWGHSANLRDNGHSPRLGTLAWYGANSGRTTHAVGEKETNPYGLKDMLGNVWEWCQDCRSDYQGLPDLDPVCLDSGARRVIRGGAWSDDARYCRAACRLAYWPDDRYVVLSLRLAGGQQA